MNTFANTLANVRVQGRKRRFGHGVIVLDTTGKIVASSLLADTEEDRKELHRLVTEEFERWIRWPRIKWAHALAKKGESKCSNTMFQT